MEYLYTFIIAFVLIFLSELGDKTQILVLSFTSKNKTSSILIGVALGSLFSYGLAILFGSKISSIGNNFFLFYLKIITYLTFILFGILGFYKLKKSNSEDISTESDSNLIRFFNNLTNNCIFLVASTIAIGELGDKTFLASIGLGVEYPLFKISLICGCIFGMLFSDSIAIFFGKLLQSKFSTTKIDVLSNIIFIIFGLLGLINLL